MMSASNGGYLQLAGVSKRFGETVVLNDLDLSIGEGEFISLIGPSGSGKTTTLRIIAGLESPTTGSVHIGGQDITALLPNQRDFGMVFQHFALFPHLDVFQNVAYGLRIRGMKHAEIEKIVLPMLDRVSLRELATRKIGELSGGQRQRVGIARALVVRPRLLLLARYQVEAGDANRAEGAAQGIRPDLHPRHPQPERGAGPGGQGLRDE
jgi:ABC-type Fe3+/spermidine/putrescine transport system ATPase subunit